MDSGSFDTDDVEPIAPPDWYYSLAPLRVDGDEALDIDALVARLNELVDSCTETDSTPLGRVLHVAHILKIEQCADGDWPAVANARTGRQIGDGRTRTPVPLFIRLGDLLDSFEFDAAVRLARDQKTDWFGEFQVQIAPRKEEER